MIQIGNRESVLVAQRSQQVREFAHIETAATVLRELGIVRFEVDGTEHRQTDTPPASRRASAARQKMRDVHARAAQRLQRRPPANHPPHYSHIVAAHLYMTDQAEDHAATDNVARQRRQCEAQDVTQRRQVAMEHQVQYFR